MRSMAWVFGVVAVLGLAVGCTPRVKVIASPKPHQSGIRYYRPKPYLLVTSGQASVTVNDKEKTTTTTTVPDIRYVNIQLQYLPDFEEEYALDVKTGLGTANVNLTLEDGWNLTGINQQLDSQTDENLEAVANVVGALSKLPLAQGEKGGASENRQSSPTFCVKATNVPLGYYESVYERDACGRKRLVGFRYLGFMPYAACPLIMTGVECGHCATTEMYGLVFVGDCMVFKPLHEVQGEIPEQHYATAGALATPSSNVERTITYEQNGAPSSATVTVTDSFQVPRSSNDAIQVPIPTLNPGDNENLSFEVVNPGKPQ